MRVVLCGAGRIGGVHAANLARSARVSQLVISDLVPAEHVGWLVCMTPKHDRWMTLSPHAPTAW